MKETIKYSAMNNDSNIRLSGNESYISLPDDLLSIMFDKLKCVELNRYPDSDSNDLTQEYAKYANVDKENVIAGNGSDEMINLIIGNVINKGKKLLTLEPDFSMYDFYAAINEGQIIKYKFDYKEKFNVDKFIALGLENDVDLVIFSNPNNPTGYKIDTIEIKKILEAFKEKTVLVDEAYYEFCGESMVSFINEYKNLVVTRTLSKAWGLAALRVGFLISSKENIKKLKEFKVPYNVNSVSQVLATEVLKRPNMVIENSKEIINQREILYKELQDIQKNSEGKIVFYKSYANYIFGSSSLKENLIKVLSENGISIRSFKDDTFRITIGSKEENIKVLEMIRKIL